MLDRSIDCMPKMQFIAQTTNFPADAVRQDKSLLVPEMETPQCALGKSKSEDGVHARG